MGDCRRGGSLFVQMHLAHELKIYFGSANRLLAESGIVSSLGRF